MRSRSREFVKAFRLGVSARVGTVIALSVQEGSVVALGRSLFEKRVPAGSRHFAQLAPEGPTAR